MAAAIDLVIPCDQPCRLENRNGGHDITGLRVWLSVDGRTVYVQGIGWRGVELRGGLILTTAQMDELARRWLAGRQGPVQEHDNDREER